VKVTLNAAGRRLVARPGGLKAQVVATVRTTAASKPVVLKAATKVDVLDAIALLDMQGSGGRPASGRAHRDARHHERAGLLARLLLRQQDPEQRVDEDLGAGDEQQREDEQQTRGPGLDAKPAAEAGAHAAEDATLGGADEAFTSEAVAEVVHFRFSWG
jgi:hypothetical protein